MQDPAGEMIGRAQGDGFRQLGGVMRRPGHFPENSSVACAVMPWAGGLSCVRPRCGLASWHPRRGAAEQTAVLGELVRLVRR